MSFLEGIFNYISNLLKIYLFFFFFFFTRNFTIMDVQKNWHLIWKLRALLGPV